MTRSRTSFIATATILLLTGTGVAHASGPVKITASDAAAGDNFGRSVSLDGDTMIVGAEDCCVDSPDRAFTTVPVIRVLSPVACATESTAGKEKL